MSNNHSADVLTHIDNRTMTIERKFHAPVQYVYKAWTDPQHLARWFGPEGFTLTTRAYEFKQGGTWSYIMHGPDGTDYDNLITYVEITENERIVYLHGDTENPEWFTTSVTFVSEGDHTRLTMSSTFKSAAALEQSVREYGALEGGISTLARLGEELPMVQFHSAQDRMFTVERVFNAPKELVFEVFTKAEHLIHWWGPEDMTLPVCNIDFRVGGKWHYCMRSLDQNIESWGLSVFKEIDAPNKFVQIDSFSDAEGNINTSLPTMTMTNLFIDLGSTTKVVCHTEYATPEELQAVLEMGMLHGMTESWNRLARYVNSL